MELPSLDACLYKSTYMVVSKTNNRCSNIVRFAPGKRLILFVLIVREQKRTKFFGIKYVDQLSIAHYNTNIIYTY